MMTRSLTTSGSRGPGGPGPRDFFKIMQFSSNFLQGKNTYFFSKFWAQGPPLGLKLRWAPQTKILDPPLLFV